MSDQYARTRILIGEQGLLILKKARVIVFGIGGVGGSAAEALARAGIGTLALVDRDVVDETNLNRQIIALHSTIGKPKVEVLADRIRDIDPSIKVHPHQCFYLPETAGAFDLTDYDYVVDAVDNVTAKIELAVRAHEAGTPLIASMGTGNRLDAGEFRIADLADTYGCPLAKVMRRELKARGIERQTVVFAPDAALKSRPPGSISFVPPVAGLLMAGQVVRDLLKQGGFQHV